MSPIFVVARGAEIPRSASLDSLTPGSLPSFGWSFILTEGLLPKDFNCEYGDMISG